MLLSAPSLIPNTLSIFGEFAYDRTVPINLNDSIYISTTTPVVDSQGHHGSPLIFNHQTHPILKNLTTFNINSSQIQFFQCSKSLVTQTVGINSQSNTIISGSLYPNIYKNHSTWVPAGNLDFTPQNSTLLGDNLVRESHFLGFYSYTYYVSGQKCWATVLTCTCGHGMVWMSKRYNVRP